MTTVQNEVYSRVIIPTSVGLAEHMLTLGLRSIIDHKQYSPQKISGIEIAKDIYSTHGSLGFFKGAMPMLTSVGLSHSALFYCLEKSKTESQSSKVMLWGAAGKFFHDAFMVPGDTVRQHCNLSKLSVRQSITSIYKRSGYPGFFYGLLPSLLISIPTGSIEFYTVKKLSDKYGVSNMFVWGGIAGIFSSILTSPIDRLKTMYQMNGSISLKSSDFKLNTMFRGAILRSFSASITYGMYEYLSKFIDIQHD